MATHNEEKNLARCLDSVSELADEIIIVDGESTDKTIEIAKKYNAKIFETTNKPIFHINKQKAIDESQGNWILQLDADEALSAELKNEINLVIKSSSNFDGYWLPRRNYFLGKFLAKGGQYPDYTLRLYRKSKGHLPCQSVHEQATVEGKVGYLKGDLLHYPFPTFEAYLAKASRYAILLSAQYEERKVKTNFFAIFKYLIWFPKWTFFNLYFRHLGFMDGFPGFVFSLFSSIQIMMAYVLYWEKAHAKRIK